jgi:hypothetical protein
MSTLLLLGALQYLLGRIAVGDEPLDLDSGEPFLNECIHALFRTGDDLAHKTLDGTGRDVETDILRQRRALHR